MDSISYLFALEAEQLLMASMPEDAIELCQKGLKKYPNYASAIYVIAKAYIYLGQNAQAVNIVNEYEKILPANSFLALKKSLDFDNLLIIDDNNSDISDNISVETQNDTQEELIDVNLTEDNEVFENVIDNNKQNQVTIEYKQNISQNISLIPGLDKFTFSNSKNLFGTLQPKDVKKIKQINRHQSNIEHIQKSLANAEPIKVENTKSSEKSKQTIVVTDTIADILFKQGAFIEAKNAYTELSNKNPSKSEFYNEKIKEIDLKMND